MIQGGFKMQKRRIVYTVLILIVVAAAIFLSKNVKTSESSVPMEPLNLSQEIYFVEKENSRLTFEMREIGGSSLEDTLQKALEEMRTQPRSENLSVAIPEALGINSLSISDGTVTVDVSGNYTEMKKGEEMFCRAALVWTFTGFYFVDNVEILVDGQPLTKTDGEAFGPMGRNDLIVDANIEAEPTNATRLLTLYFANNDASGLVAEERRVEVNPNQPVEKYVVEQLIAGPAEEGHQTTVPAETKIRDIQTADGICYVDLSQDFVAKHGGGSTGEMLTIYSIVNSLCELNDVERVQFLIEGEKQDEFKGHMDFGKPFEPIEVESTVK